MFKLNIPMLNKLDFVKLGKYEWKIKIDYSNIVATEPRYYVQNSRWDKYYSKQDCIDALEETLSEQEETGMCNPCIIKSGENYYYLHIVSPKIVYAENYDGWGSNYAMLDFSKYGMNDIVYMDSERDFVSKKEFNEYYEKRCKAHPERYVHV